MPTAAAAKQPSGNGNRKGRRLLLQQPLVSAGLTNLDSHSVPGAAPPLDVVSKGSFATFKASAEKENQTQAGVRLPVRKSLFSSNSSDVQASKPTDTFGGSRDRGLDAAAPMAADHRAEQTDCRPSNSNMPDFTSIFDFL